MEFTTSEQAKEAIKKWLTENHHVVNEIDDKNVNFHFEIDYPLGSQKRQRIIQPKDYPGLIVLLNGVAIAPDHTGKLKDMSEDERDEFYSEIRHDLLFQSNSYDIHMDEDGIAKQIQFSYEFYFDAPLTKTRLYEGLLVNHRSLLYVVTKFNDEFGVPSMPAGSKDTTVGTA